MRKPFDLGWIVGLLEGEGSFNWDKRVKVINKQRKVYHYGRPKIQVASTDPDTIERFADMVQATTNGPYFYGNQPVFCAMLQHNRAIALMRLVYPYMSARRKATIASILEAA